MTEETTERKPRRSAKEIAQAHADRAVAKVEKHDDKLEKAKAKYEKARSDYDELREQRSLLVREADYRQSHPLLEQQEAEEAMAGAQAEHDRDVAEGYAGVDRDFERNPFE